MRLFIWNRWGWTMSDSNRCSSRDLQLYSCFTHTKRDNCKDKCIFLFGGLRVFSYNQCKWITFPWTRPFLWHWCHQPTKGFKCSQKSAKKLINQALGLTLRSVKQLNSNSQALPGWVWHSSHIPLCTGEQWERRLCGQRCWDGPWPGRLSLRIGF